MGAALTFAHSRVVHAFGTSILVLPKYIESTYWTVKIGYDWPTSDGFDRGQVLLLRFRQL